MEKPCTGNEKKKIPDLLSSVFSWSVKDILNNNLYKDKVQKIPEVFSSTAEYLNSFKLPLIEETRADFCSGLESVGQSPASEISWLRPHKDYKPPKDLYYKMMIKQIRDLRNPGGHYEPQSNDVFVVTNVRPRSIGDLIRPGKYIVFAYVVPKIQDDGSIMIRSSEKLVQLLLSDQEGEKERLFITYLINLTTNLRIWTALHPDPRSTALGLIENVLQYDPSVDEGDCNLCISDESCNAWRSVLSKLIRSYLLDESQKNAVLSSISMVKCSHRKNNVKLIWGPPGTGKTKTVASMLFALLKLKCRTLTCAPTNIAVLQVAKRVVKLFIESLRIYDTYGLGDIVLYGNGERMKIDDHEDLVDVFLAYRVKILGECLSPLDGWKYNLEYMIHLLEDPRQRYKTYLSRGEKNEDDEGDEGNNSTAEQLPAKSITSIVKEFINQLKGKVKKEQKVKTKDPGRSSEDGKNNETEIKMTYEEFLMKTFYSVADRLSVCAKNLYTHLPTSSLPLSVAKQMIALAQVLKSFENAVRGPFHQFIGLMDMNKEQLLSILKSLHAEFPKPKIELSLWNFCLKNACLIFCTASGSIKMGYPVEMVVIDEAAQLKECESTIPFQIPGVRNAILIGDDRQLPAMVQSKVLGDMNFGRSLFQRLATLGKKKHLLNIQYRMHPSISTFPNSKFYENNIIDASNVRLRSYTRSFLKGDMYGSYSFINVSGGSESYKQGHSPRNVEEANVVQSIIRKLFNYHSTSKQALSVGIISPYKGQVGLMQEKLRNKYVNHNEDGFCVSVRSVDGFQGGEEDIIIISTVRSNNNGFIGFLSNHQRTNVALTRARYCLWIVGNGSTLANSGSVWQDLVNDAKTRGCFYNADEDTDLIKLAEISSRKSISELLGSLKLAEARWKLVFSYDFKNSLASIKSNETQKQVMEMLKKIAEGWRLSESENTLKVANQGVSSGLLEQYKVDELLYLAWSTDILSEKSKQTQVIKIWNIVQESEFPKLANYLDVLFGKYTVNFMNRCKYKSLDRDLVLPMSWPLQSDSLGDPSELLSSQLANIRISDGGHVKIRPTFRNKMKSKRKK